LDQRWERFRFRDAPAVLEFTWSPSSCGADAVLKFRLKVRRGEEEASFDKALLVPGDELQAPESAPTRVRFRSRLALESGAGPGRISVNGIFVGDVDNGPPFELQARARPGKNTLTAFLPRPRGASGWWRFDFSGEQKLTPGSLRVRAGRVLARQPDALVLEPGGRIELVFELGPSR